MARCAQLLDNQKRFVRDTAHQLRTPLAVLKTQVQSALRGDVEPRQALQEIKARWSAPPGWPTRCCRWPRSSRCSRSPAEPSRLAEVVRAVALELSPLIADEELDFEIRPRRARARHDWMLRELTRNLLHNAIKHTPAGGMLWCSWSPTPTLRL